VINSDAVGNFDEWTAITHKQDEMYRMDQKLKDIERKKQQEFMK
jgi:hypothetical protein